MTFRLKLSIYDITGRQGCLYLALASLNNMLCYPKTNADIQPNRLYSIHFFFAIWVSKINWNISNTRTYAAGYGNCCPKWSNKFHTDIIIILNENINVNVWLSVSLSVGPFNNLTVLCDYKSIVRIIGKRGWGGHIAGYGKNGDCVAEQKWHLHILMTL